ncbi:multivesicular body subunit 12B [Diabrotica undecimpunctata]|uniref:multivesicular body subunit 12B n=1 Tax=Diabrotica undecimpunctata TaxID=50387 RepID=UPI003B642319
MLKSSVQHKILNYLPDDRPITAIQIIENLDKCPRGFFAINKTYDQDSDADLRESSIFKSSSARYLCLSKTEGLPNFVVQEILVLGDKANPPKGFSLLNKTADSEQKAWKKKQICYRLVNRKDIKTAVTDIIICSRLKKAPSGFSFAGELNGVTLCYKMGNVQDSQANSNDQFPPERPPKPNVIPTGVPVYPPLANTDHDYEILRPGAYPSVLPGGPGGPTRPAPKPPAPVQHQNSTHTMNGPSHMGLDGVPFIVNPKFLTTSNQDRFQFPRIKARTMQQLIKDYNYPFTVERQT